MSAPHDVRAPRGVPPGEGDRRVWTHIFIEFSLAADERRDLDTRLAAEGTTLPRIVIDALSSYVRLTTDSVVEATDQEPGDQEVSE